MMFSVATTTGAADALEVLGGDLRDRVLARLGFTRRRRQPSMG